MHRRLTSLLLVLLFAGAPVLSAIATVTVSSDLPDCCKKNGAHMCSIRRGRGKQEDGKPQLRANCPFGGKATLAVAAQRTGIAADNRSYFMSAPEHRTALGHSISSPLLASHFENPKRGPPSVSF